MSWNTPIHSLGISWNAGLNKSFQKMTEILRHPDYTPCLIAHFDECNIYITTALSYIYDWCARAGNLYKHITLLCLYFIDIPSCMTVFLKTIYHINKKYSNKTLSNVRVYMRKLCMIFWMWTNGITMSNQYLQNYEVYSGWQFSCGGAHVRGISVTWNGLLVWRNRSWTLQYHKQKLFLLILVLWHVLNKNQPDATLAPLGNFFLFTIIGVNRGENKLNGAKSQNCPNLND